MRAVLGLRGALKRAVGAHEGGYGEVGEVAWMAVTMGKVVAAF